MSVAAAEKKGTEVCGDDFYIRYLDRAGVIRCGGGNYALAVQEIEKTLRLQIEGKTRMPAELALRLPDIPDRANRCNGSSPAPLSDAGIYALPAYVGGEQPVAGIKWTAHSPNNVQRNQPRIMGLIILNDPTTGAPVAVIESGLIGAMRTAAASATAIIHLGRGQARMAAIYGAGFQAHCHLQMLAQLFPNLEEVVICNRDFERAQRLSHQFARAAPWKLSVEAFGPGPCARSDLLITCTAAPEPFVQADWIHSGMLAIHVGLFEFSFEAIGAFDKIVVDRWGDFKNTSRKSLFRMYQAGKLAQKDIYADLATLFEGRRPVVQKEAVFFNNFGLNIFDIALAQRIFFNAEQLGEGCLLSLLGVGPMETNP